MHPAQPDDFFGTGLPGALKALTKALPSEQQWSNKRIREYFELVLPTLSAMNKVQRGWPPFMLQAFRFLALERLIHQRTNFPMTPAIKQILAEIKTTPEVVATLARERLKIGADGRLTPF